MYFPLCAECQPVQPKNNSHFFKQHISVNGHHLLFYFQVILKKKCCNELNNKSHTRHYFVLTCLKIKDATSKHGAKCR